MATDLTPATTPDTDAMLIQVLRDRASGLVAVGLDDRAARTLYDILEAVDLTDLEADGYTPDDAADVTELVSAVRPALRKMLYGY